MGKRVVLLLICILLTACGFDAADIGTLVPESGQVLDKGSDQKGEEATLVDDSPRIAPAAELPPTWTPGAPQPQLKPVTTSNITQPEETPVAPGTTYIVQAGDTLAEIAMQFNVPMDKLATLNGIADLDHIEVGQVLVIPSQ